jgi:hypothetical protein
MRSVVFCSVCHAAHVPEQVEVAVFQLLVLVIPRLEAWADGVW